MVDTPGFFDTDRANTNEMVKSKIVEQIFGLTSPGVHAFLFILSLGPYTPEEKQTVEFIETIFGPQVTQYGIVVFTHLDQFEQEEIPQSIDTFVQRSPPALQELVRKCGGRTFAINNRIRDHRLEQHVKPLLEMIDYVVQINSGKCYTNAEYERVEKSRRLGKTSRFV